MGSTITNSPTLIQPIGTNIRLTVVDVTSFPKYSYILISDGVYSFVGCVINQDTVGNVLTVKVLSILNASLGSTIQSGATVTFSGPPGPVGTVPEIGVEGTVQYSRMLFSPGSTYFNSSQGLTTATTLGTIAINLPGVLSNGLAPNFDVVAELDCSIATNQVVTNAIAYVGIGASQLPLTGTATQIFAGYISPPQSAPMIPNSACVADTSVSISSPGVSGMPGRAVFSGTYPSNSNPSFSLLVTAMQPNTTFYVSANLKITAYPLYD